MKLRLALILALAAAAFPLSADPDVRDTRLLSEPAVSATRIAFIYAGDLWIADLDGGNVRRLTTDVGSSRVRPSRPTGSGSPSPPSTTATPTSTSSRPRAACRRRLTWHPGPDIVRGFTPDGKAVLFIVAAQRLHRPLHAALHRAGRRRHADTQLPIPHGVERRLLARRQAHRLQPARRPLAAVEALPRRRRLAHLDLRRQRPRGREDPAARRRAANDVDPQWIGEHDLLPLRPRRRVQPVRLRHEVEDGPPADRATTTSRSSTPRPAAATSSTSRRATCTCFDPGNGARERGSKIGVAATCSRPAPRFVKGGEVHPQRSPSRRRGAGGVRVPRRDRHRAGREGRPANLTEHARRPRALAGLVARRQVDRLLLRRGGRVPAARPRRQDGKGEAAKWQAPAAPASTRTRPGRPTARRSPTSTTRSRSTGSTWRRQGRRRSASRAATTAPTDRTLQPAWSPDSQVDRLRARQQGRSSRRVYVYSLDQDKSLPITDGLSDAIEPVFDAQRQVPVLLRLDRRRPGQQLVRAESNADMRVDALDLPGGAAKGPAVAARARRATRRRRHGSADAEGRRGREKDTKTKDRASGREIRRETEAAAAAEPSDRLRRHRPAHPRPAGAGRRAIEPAGGRGGADLLPARRADGKNGRSSAST